MATTASVQTKKRPRTPQAAPEKTRKRQKPAGKQVASSKPVRLDELQWSEVAVSGLDDYEGFYGLEEIDDVDVVKDESTSSLSFRKRPDKPTKTDKHAREKKTPKPNTSQKPAAIDGDSVKAVDDEEDDWEGFDDEPAPPSRPKRDDELDTTNAFNLLPTEETETKADVDVTAWDSINLSPQTLTALSRLGFSKPTNIQSASIPPIMAGQDIIGKAPTGSGKTLAFGLPILESLLQSTTKQAALALIIEPTRELAHQIATHLNALKSDTTFKKLNVATLTGGLSIQKQRRVFETADILVATPGRLWEIVEGSKDVLDKLRQLQVLVIDEADRLLSQGHFKELEHVLTALDRKEVDEDGQTLKHGNRKARQTLVFSATFARELQQKLAKQSKFYQNATNKDSMAYLLKKLNFRAQPRFIDVNPTAPMAAQLKEAMIEIPSGLEKDLYLYAVLLLHRPIKQTRSLVFVNSIAAVRRIVPFLKYLKLDALPLHSQMEQKARLRSVERFSGLTGAGGATQGLSTSILVATDVAARGLDIPEVHTVIHYHVPRTADGYIHRSGRTARASASGTSILICAPQEAAGVRRLVAQVHARKAGSGRRDLQMVEPEARIVTQLKPRAALAKSIADAESAKEKQSSKESWIAEAADDLGIDLEDGDLETGESKRGKKAKGKKRKEREAEGRAMSKAELREAKAGLRDMLSTRVNTGVSARYLTSGNVDIAALLKQREESGILGGGFLGQVSSLL